jgi:plastocyanin
MRRHYRLLIASVPLLVLLGLASAGVVSAGGGCHAETEPIATEGSSATVMLEGCTFTPTIARVPVGAEVKFVNASVTPHDVTGRKFAWRSEQLELGESHVQRFTAPGLYPYSCSLHPGMAGVVIVGSPDFALASDVEVPPIQPGTAATSAAGGDAMLPIMAAGGLGVLAGALLAGGIVSRRRRAG